MDLLYTKGSSKIPISKFREIPWFFPNQFFIFPDHSQFFL